MKNYVSGPVLHHAQIIKTLCLNLSYWDSVGKKRGQKSLTLQSWAKLMNFQINHFDKKESQLYP